MLPSKDRNIAAILAWRAENQPHRTAIYVPRVESGQVQSEYVSVSYRQLYDQANGVAREIAATIEMASQQVVRDLDPARIIVANEPGLDFVSSFFGCLYAGAIPVPLQPPRNKVKPDERWQRVLTDCSPVGICFSSGIRPHDAETPSELDQRASQAQVCSPAFLQYTSGSTGVPKGVIVSHDNLLHNLEQIRVQFGHDQESVGVIWLPPYHDMGLIGGILQPIYAGFPVVLMSPLTFIRNPYRWLEAISRFGATTSGGPNFAYEHTLKKTSAESRATLDLSRWSVAFIGAEAVRERTLSRFAKTFSECQFNASSFLPCYGLAESTLIVSGRRATARFKRQICETDDPQIAQVRSATSTSCGPIIEGLDVRIVDPVTFNVIKEGETGEIWIRGASVTKGYWNRNFETEDAFQARTASGDGPFLRTGDLGYVQNSELFVRDRLKDMIVIRGQNYFPADLEHAVDGVVGENTDTVTAAIPFDDEEEECLVILNEVRRAEVTDNLLTQRTAQIRAVISNQFGLTVRDVMLLKSGALPRTKSGKIQRLACRERYRRSVTPCAQSEDDVDPIRFRRLNVQQPRRGIQPSLTLHGIEDWLVAQLATKLRVTRKAISTRRPFAEMGVDSVMAVELAHELTERVGLQEPLEPIFIWQYPTVDAVCRRCNELADSAEHHPSPSEDKSGSSNCRDLTPPLETDSLENDADFRAHVSSSSICRDRHVPVVQQPIAIVGMSCRLPGSVDSPQSFWHLLRNGGDAVSEIPADRWDVDRFFDANPEVPGKMYTRQGAFIDSVADFDPEFFGISPREATYLDPQQRLLLEGAYLALSDAGLDPFDLRGSNTGTYVGLSLDDYAQRHARSGDMSHVHQHSSLGSLPAVGAGRIAYVFGLQGPAMQLDTTCSSSLVATHLACQSLRNGETDLALAGGVNLILSPASMIACCKLRALSPDGRCYTFSRRANGYVRGEGCGVVVLQRLADAIADRRPIYAVLRSSAVNHDGQSNGLTAPNAKSQAKLIRKTLQLAGLTPSDIDYVEAHGTGTSLGDPIELRALSEVFDRRARQLRIGSVKTNIGHLESAAGIASLMKVVLAMQQDFFPKHLNCEQLSEQVEWSRIPVSVETTGVAWGGDNGPKFAGVSSFGMSGTNAHVIVEQPKEVLLRQKWPEPIERGRLETPFKRQRFWLDLPNVANSQVAELFTPGMEQELTDRPVVPNTDLDSGLAGGRHTEEPPTKGQADVVVEDQQYFQRLVTTKPGSLNSLEWRRELRQSPQRDEVEIQVRDAGLNFRDVLIAMGLYPEAADLGCECVGVVSRLGPDVRDLNVGDEVMAIGSGCFAEYVVTSRKLVISTSGVKFPVQPVVFCTAAHALLDLAKLQPGETLLIHAATGGVGQAAVSIARAIGATVYGTAHQTKWATLRELGMDPPMDSRTLNFASQLMDITNGQGVDVVLNSLPGAGRRRSFDVLAHGGRFVEIGKGPGPSSSELEALRPEVRHYDFDLGQFCVENPDDVQRLLRLTVDRLNAGEWEPTPTQMFEWDDIGDAFRTLQASKHIGKLVVGASQSPVRGRSISLDSERQAVDVPESASLAPASFLELEAYLCGRVSRVLGYAPDQLDRTKGFYELGLDSLTALELKNSMQRELGIEVPSTVVFDYPNTNSMLSYLARRLEISQDQLDVGQQLDNKLAEIDKLLG